MVSKNDLPEKGRYSGDYFATIEFNPGVRRFPYRVTVWQWRALIHPDRGYWTKEYVHQTDHHSEVFKTARAAVNYKNRVMSHADLIAVNRIGQESIDSEWIRADG